MAKKSKAPKVDGFSPDNAKRLRAAIRQVWSWSHAWRLVKARCLIKDGFSKCELCLRKVPKIYVDHINPCGAVDGHHYIPRMFVPSNQLQGLCKKCHDSKTKEENKVAKKATVKSFL